MNVQALLPFSPFLALLYVVFALVQSLRKKQQGIGAAILAFIAIAIPLAVLLLTQDAATRLTLMGYLAWNAIIVFVGSIIIRMIERRNSAREGNRSYGMLGIGLGVLMALEIMAYPFVIAPLTGTSAFPNASQSVAGSPAFVAAVTAQTGLSADEVTTKLQSGTKIADLVTQHNGDVKTVISAAAKSLDDMQAQGGPAVQFISNLGTNSTDIATQFVQGTLNTQGQRILTAILLGGGTGSFSRNGQTSSGSDGGTQTVAQAPQNSTSGISAPAGFSAPGQNDTSNNGASPTSQTTQNSTDGISAPAGFSPPGQNNANNSQTVGQTTQNSTDGISAPAGFSPPVQDTSADNGDVPDAAPTSSNQSVGQVASVPTAQPNESPATPTESVVRPTVIAFPSPTLTPDVTQSSQPGAESTQDVSSQNQNAATCKVTPFYNLNLRDKPNTGGKIYLSIPYGTPVTANGRTADDWYSVTYNGQAGWVSGQYISADTACKTIAVVTVDS